VRSMRMDSEIWTPWQGGAEIRSLVPIGAPKMAVGNYWLKILAFVPFDRIGYL
jgi:hypothetical protein